MDELTPRARHLVQLLAEELDRTGLAWAAMMLGDGLEGPKAWDWRVDFVTTDGADVSFRSNAGTNMADVVPINRVR